MPRIHELCDFESVVRDKHVVRMSGSRPQLVPTKAASLWSRVLLGSQQAVNRIVPKSLSGSTSSRINPNNDKGQKRTDGQKRTLCFADRSIVGCHVLHEDDFTPFEITYSKANTQIYQTAYDLCGTQ